MYHTPTFHFHLTSRPSRFRKKHQPCFFILTDTLQLPYVTHIPQCSLHHRSRFSTVVLDLDRPVLRTVLSTDVQRMLTNNPRCCFCSLKMRMIHSHRQIIHHIRHHLPQQHPPQHHNLHSHLPPSRQTNLFGPKCTPSTRHML